MKAKLRYWYKIFIGACPVCCRDAGYRVRQYTKKPKSKRKCYEYLSDMQTYCGCPP